MSIYTLTITQYDPPPTYYFETSFLASYALRSDQSLITKNCCSIFTNRFISPRSLLSSYIPLMRGLGEGIAYDKSCSPGSPGFIWKDWKCHSPFNLQQLVRISNLIKWKAPSILGDSSSILKLINHSASLNGRNHERVYGGFWINNAQEKITWFCLKRKFLRSFKLELPSNL